MLPQPHCPQLDSVIMLPPLRRPQLDSVIMFPSPPAPQQDSVIMDCGGSRTLGRAITPPRLSVIKNGM
jgi:hypothetical protein